ncbi:hypothetical protein BJV78DRAFT_1169627 [Lactifluus subvellereus]|nr:hypothetical protein BJV78DRAFT_1169627 [Lactifluus subvellereus]
MESESLPFIPNQLHPCYFPYPTSFTAGDTQAITHFQYLKSLEDNSTSISTSITYLAEITNQSSAMGGCVQT